MRGSVSSARYSPICNVLRQWKTSLIPIYRLYRLYDYKLLILFIYIFQAVLRARAVNARATRNVQTSDRPVEVQ